ncbi:MAG: O-antigen ligase family protein [Candidatus Omnitrophota bacterium]|nr:O-antigen ligase family protein [Candidatus Omnitrophota bacterium]
MVEEVKDKRQIGRIVFSVAAGLILASFDEVWQVFVGEDFIRGYAPVVNIGLVRATAAFKDANTLGIYLSAIAPLIFGLTLYYFKKQKKALMWGLSLIVLAGILLTYSRPTLLAIYIVLFFLGIAKKDKATIALLIIFTLISPFILPKSVKNWAREVEYNPFRFICNDDRIAVYRNSLNMIKDHPFIGLGANTYMKNYKKYREPIEYRNIVTKDYMYAHNNFLHMAAEIGLIGLGFFIWLLYKLFMECKDIYRKLEDDYMKIVSLSLSACLIAFLVNGLTESSLYYSRVAIIFWYIMGLALALKKIASR